MSRTFVVAGLVPVILSTTFVIGLAVASPAYAAKGFTGVDQPTVAGTFAVGSTLTAKRDARTSPKATTVTYTWMRNGKAISKATKSKYRLAKTDQGNAVSVRVCYKKKKYTTSCVTSAQSTIAAKMTTSQTQAVRMAQSYLNSQAFSRSGLIEQLEYEGFSEPDSVFAVDHVAASWTDQAVRMAGSYLKSQAFSRSGLISQLEYEGFTPEDSSDAADHVGANWAAQAVRMAKEYLKSQAFSRSGLISQLEYEGFSTEDAAAAADAVGL